MLTSPVRLRTLVVWRVEGTMNQVGEEVVNGRGLEEVVDLSQEGEWSLITRVQEIASVLNICPLESQRVPSGVSECPAEGVALDRETGPDRVVGPCSAHYDVPGVRGLKKNVMKTGRS